VIGTQIERNTIVSSTSDRPIDEDAERQQRRAERSEMSIATR
jgi:hypothetical protein